jgi:hypothetical protein
LCSRKTANLAFAAVDDVDDLAQQGHRLGAERAGNVDEFDRTQAPLAALVLDGEGLSDEMQEAASAAGRLHEQTLASLVTASLDPEHVAAEDDPVADLTSLRAQLAAALSQVDSALERLKRR